jgi:hypothetical protein
MASTPTEIVTLLGRPMGHADGPADGLMRGHQAIGAALDALDRFTSGTGVAAATPSGAQQEAGAVRADA